MFEMFWFWWGSYLLLPSVLQLRLLTVNQPVRNHRERWTSAVRIKLGLSPFRPEPAPPRGTRLLGQSSESSFHVAAEYGEEGLQDLMADMFNSSTSQKLSVLLPYSTRSRVSQRAEILSTVWPVIHTQTKIFSTKNKPSKKLRPQICMRTEKNGVLRATTSRSATVSAFLSLRPALIFLCFKAISNQDSRGC